MLLDNPYISDVRVEKETNSLKNAGFNVSIIAYKDIKQKKKEIKNGCEILRILDKNLENPLSKTYNFKLNFFINKIIKLEFDIIYCHDFYLLKLASKLKKLKPNTKLIYDSHEYLKGWPFFLDNKGLINKIKGYFVWKKLIQNEKKYIKNVDLIITITDSILQKLGKLNKSANKVVIGNYPEKIKLIKSEKYFHEKFNISYGNKIIVHSGSIYHSKKELLQLFDEIKKHNELVLIFLCNRPYISEIKKIVNSDLQLNRKIFFHDYINNKNKLISILSSADIGLMHLRLTWTAHKIGFSNKLMEYIQAEIPIIATPQEFTKTINNKYNCCVFYKKHNNEFNKSLSKIITNYEYYKTNSLNASDQFLWEYESDKLIYNVKKLIVK
ncbi:MAG: hypothetical protein CL853_05845 [Crocinitomicaceae bacterium]|nr:hypothetical protein [Crocinitomicaceae bacterium]